MKVQITVDDMVWRAARVSALGAGETMGEFVSRAIVNLTGPVGVSTVMSGSARMNSEVTGKSERDRQMEESPPVKVNPSIYTGDPIMGKCSRCGDSVKVTELVVEPRTGKKYCTSCVENLKNGQA